MTRHDPVSPSHPPYYWNSTNMPPTPVRALALYALSPLLCPLLLVPPASAREWTDATGRFRMEAEFVGQQDGQVRLKKPDGQTVQLPLSRLSQTDQDYVRQRAAQPQPRPNSVNAAPEPAAGAPPILHTLGGHRGTIRGLLFSPKGLYLASSADKETGVRLWDPANGKQFGSLKHDVDRGLASLAFTRDDRLLAAGGPNASLVVWQAGAGNGIELFRNRTDGGAFSAVAFSNDAKTVIAATGLHVDTLSFFDVPSGKRLAVLQLKGFIVEVSSIALSPDGKFLAVAAVHMLNPKDTRDGAVSGESACVIHVVYLKSNRETTRLTLKNDDFIPDLRFLPNSREIIFGGASPRRWNLLRREPTPLLDAAAHHKGPVALAADNNSQTLASYDTHGTIGIWDLGTQRLLRKWNTGILRPLCALNASGTLLAVTGDGRDAIQVYDLSKK